MTSFGYRLNPRYAIKECSSCGALYTGDFCCSKGNVEDKILVPELPKNCASTNVVNAPREPFIVKQDHGSLVDKIICDLNKAPDSPHLHTFLSNQRHCFHCKDVLGDGEFCQRCTYTSISEISSQNPPHIDERCYECGDALDGIFCQRCTCFDQTQPPQFPVIHPPPRETSIKILHDQENIINDVQTFLRKFNRYSFFETPKVLLLAWDRVFKIKDAFGNKQYKPKDIQELFRKLLNDLQNIHEELAEYINTPGWNRPTFYNNGDDDDVDYTIAITPVLSIEEPDNSLSMGDEHLDTIPTTESEKVIKSSVKGLRSFSKLSRGQTSNPTSSTNPTPKGRIRRSSEQKVENSNFEENLPLEVLMADNRTMVQLLQAPTEGYEDAIVIPEIAATNFEIKHGLINLVQKSSFSGMIKKTRTLTSQRFDESFSEAWDRFNDLLRASPHHGFSELHQLDTFCNALNVNDQDSLNSAAGGNFLDKIPSDCLKIIESKSKVRQARAKAVIAKVNSSSSTPAISSDIAELKDMVRALLLDKKNQYSAPAPSPTHAPVKAVEPNCVTCDGSRTLPGNTITNPKEDLNGITTRSGVAYQGPAIPTPSKVAKQGTEVTKDQVKTPSSQSTVPVQPPVVQSESKTLVSEPVVAPISTPMPNLKPSIPYLSRRDNERRRDQANEQIEKFYKIFKDMSFEISFTDALILMPKFVSTLKALIGNKEKLSEMARTPMNEYSMDECLALADLGASINLVPLSVWKGLSLPELTPTCMTLELTDRTLSKPIGIAKDVSVKTDQALIDVHKGKLTIRIENEAITYNLDQTLRYSANYDQMTANKIDVTDEACEEYSQEVLSFSDVTASGSPTPSDDPIVSTTSPTLTPFGDSDFLLFEEADAFLGLEDNPNSSELDPSYYDPEGDILLLEAILNSEPSPPLPNHEQSVPSFKKKLKACEAKTIKSSVHKPPEVELKDLPPHLEYAFLEGDNKLLVIIAKELGDEEKPALIKVLKSHKRAIAWKLSDIQVFGNSFENCLSRLDKMLQRCEDTKLCLNWEKSHFMVKEGIVLGHKISKNGIEVDKAKIDVITKLPHPITVKGERKQENDKIETKPDKNGKRGKARQCRRLVTVEITRVNLVPIPSESEGIPDTMCDVHLVNNPTLLEAKDHFEIVINSNEDYSSSDYDSLYYENIEYVEALPHHSELVSLKEAEIVIPKDEEIENDNLRERLLNVNLLISNIEALKDNPTPSSEFLTKSSSTSPKSFLEETNIFDNSLPEFEKFCFDLEEISSGSTTTHSDISILDYEAFYFYDDHIE
uniref:Reverse transcriptase domain-containing protein n=1 Tax=Tanacetum cinerariifolium TaxID=118510 RepID=A0A6L2M654_TANCI|nr:hypothetical protein [Tanacetum cinerariifolium]